MTRRNRVILLLVGGLLAACDTLKAVGGERKGFMGPPVIVGSVAETPKGLLFSFQECNSHTADVDYLEVARRRADGDWDVVCRYRQRYPTSMPSMKTPFKWRYGEPISGYDEEVSCEPLKPGLYRATGGLMFTVHRGGRASARSGGCPK